MKKFFNLISKAIGFDNRLETTEYTVSSKRLPKNFDGFKISLLADLHSVIPTDLCEEIRKTSPDIICMSGDTIHHDTPYSPFIELLKELLTIAPVYIASGNHDIVRDDFENFVTDCKKCGAYFLIDETKTIEKNQDKITILGMKDPKGAKKQGVFNNIRHSLKILTPDENFSILLFHRANLIEFIADNGYDLVLSGHMHGGQVRIPKIGGVLAPKSNFFSGTGLLFPKYSGGRYKVSQTDLIVSRGIGNRTHIPRLYNRPEIVTVILKTDN